MRELVSPMRVLVSPKRALLIKIPTSTRSMVGAVLRAIVRIWVSVIYHSSYRFPLVFFMPGAPLPALDGKRTDEQHSGDESAHVREPGDTAARVIGSCKRSQAAKKLNHKPPQEHGPGWDFDSGDEDNDGHQCHDARARELDQIGAHHAGDGAARADRGQARIRIGHYLENRRGESAAQIENQKAPAADQIFHVAAEHP